MRPFQYQHQSITHLFAIFLSLFAAGIFPTSAAAQVSSGTWSATASMASARSAASAVLLQDGRVLITGGTDASGPLASAELYSGSFSPAGSMLLARSNHASVTLNDGSVLVLGGSTAFGPTNETEIYNPSTDTWTVGNAMVASRSGHTATLLKDGRVLIAGGTGSGAPGTTLEIFDPSTRLFSLAGSLTASRTNHAAALLGDGRVLITGGFNGSAALNSSDIYDPATAAVSPGQTMSALRAFHTATTLLNGDVLIAGGNDGSSDLSSAEIYSTATGFFATGSLASPRRGHKAFLLPKNNSVLIVGGSALTAELYRSWSASFVPTGAPPVSHTGGAGSALAVDGLLLMAGSDSSADLYAFATVKTNKEDYAPGETVTITGSGWQAGETVTLTLVESPLLDTHGPFTAVADAGGHILNTQFAPDQQDINIRFYLVASGDASSLQAQTTFTDATHLRDVTVLGAQTPNPVTPGNSATYGTVAANSVQVRFNGNGNCTVNLSATGLPAGATAAFAPSSLNATGTQSLFSLLTINTTVATPPGAFSFTVRADGTGGAGNDCLTTENTTTTATLVVGGATLSINDVTASEGNGPGATTFTFTVTKSGAGAATVSYATANGPTNPATGGASCAGSTDYVTTSGSLSFASGDTTKTIAVTLCGDTVYEKNETFLVNLSGATGATITDSQGVGTINNDDTQPTLSINDVTLNENNGGTTSFNFTVTKTGSTEVTATVNFATANGTTDPATAGAAGTCSPGSGTPDYETQSGSLTFLAADTTKTITVLACGDTVYEKNQTFFVNLSGAADATTTEPQGLGTITNDDSAPTVAINDATVTEGNSSMTDVVFTVSKTGVTEVDATVSFATADGTVNPATGTTGPCSDTSGTPDYLSQTSGTLTLLPTDASKTITVKACGDTVYELDQTFFVNLSNPVDATITDPQGVGTITNDDSKPALSIADLSQAEGNSGTTTFNFVVTKTGLTELPIAVNYLTAALTASEGGSCNTTGIPDYVAANGTLNIPAANPSGTISVLVCGETVYELDQTFNVNLTDPPTNATITDGQAVGTIANDDAKPTLVISDVSQSEGNAPTVDFIFNVTKTGATEVNATVGFATADGGLVPASSGAVCNGTGTPDYVTNSGNLTFHPTDTTFNITVQICGDTVYEQNQTFLVNLSNASEAIISDGQGLGTINNDDAAPVITIDDVTHAEGDSSTTNYAFTVTKTGGTEVNAVVNFTTADGTSNGATGGAAPCVTASGTPDYLTQSGSLTFLPAETTQNVTILGCGDTVFELNQTFFVNLSGAVDATIGDSQGLGTITNDDQPPSLTISDVMLNEGNASTTDFIFTVTKTGLTELNATVDYATAVGPTDPATGGSTCGAGVDYESLSSVLTLQPADATKNITVHVCGELVYEADQTFVVNLSNASYATITDNQGLGTIQNDDAPPSLSISDVMQNEGNGGPATFTFSVTKSGLTELPIAVDYSTGGGTASAGATCVSTGMPDYVTTSGTLNIPAFDSGGTIPVTVCGESVFELDQTFYVNLSPSPTNATITDGQGLGTILNDDAPPSFSIGDITLPEGNSATTPFTFTVTKTGATELDSAVSAATGAGSSEPATAGGSCVAGVDYITLTPTILTFLAEDTAKTVAVLVCGETIYERNQTFVVDLSNPVRATIGDGQAIGTINNDDAAPVITIDDITHAEGDSGTTSYAFTLTKTGETEVNATVNFATADGTSNGATGALGTCVPTSGTPDYISQTGSLTFQPADTTKSVTVLVCGDSVFELDQTFFVNLSGAVDATIGDTQGLGTITNDDAKPTLAINDVTANEGDSGITNFNFTVTKTGLTELNATANYATAPGSTNPATAGASCGVAGVDFETVSNTVMLSPADATKTVTVRVCGELVVELDQTFVVNLTNPGYATITDSQGVGTIKNDDSPTTISLTTSPSTINEGASTTLNGSFGNVEISQQQQIDINWGDGSTNTVLTLSAGTLSFTSSHQYTDDNPTATASDVYTITVTLTTVGPPNFPSGNGTTSVTVNNVAPTVALNDPGSVFPVNTPITFSATFTDPGLTADNYSAVWTFDGVPCPTVTSAVAVTKPNSTPGSVTMGCKFSVPGVYQIVLKVIDDDGGTGTADTVAGLTAQVVIYDPNGGFVTGGGWIYSTVGAFPSNPSLIGKANFGFVAKYQKGATIPTGETEFQFHTANLDFHSVSYEWLVVAGARAQYKGLGTIKGMNGIFGFMLTAIDGQVNGGGGTDKFRIKIWDAGGVIVYDNQLGLSDDGDPTTILGGGSIVVHK